MTEIKNCSNCPHHKWEEDWGDIHICNMKDIIVDENYDPTLTIHSECPLVGEEITYKWVKQ